MDEHEMEIAKKANKYLYGISDHEKVKKALELIRAFEPIDVYIADDPKQVVTLIEDLKKILETQKKTTAFGFD